MTGKLADKVTPIRLIIGMCIAVLLYFLLRRLYRETIGQYKARKVELPTGGMGIPVFSDGTAWSPLRSVEMLYEAMHGNSAAWYNPWSYGTDEKTVFLVLGDKTQDQLAALLNAYEAKYQRDLIADFKNELSGTELSRALDYFTFVKG